jgi:Peptidase family M23
MGNSSEVAPGRLSRYGRCAVDGPEPKTPADAQVASPSPPAGETGTDGGRPRDDSTSETPRTALTLPEPEAEQPGGLSRRAPSKLRAALAILGSVAAIGAIVVPLATRPERQGPTRIAKAATMAAVVSGGPLAVDDTSSDAAADAPADAEATPRPTVWRVARLADDATVTIAEGTIGKHPLLAALATAGVPRAEAHRVADSLGEVRDVDHLDPKDAYAIARDKESGRVVAYELVSSPVDVWQAREETTPGGTPRLVARRLELEAEHVRVHKAVLVGTDLRASFVEAGLAPIDDVLSMLDDALDGHAELSDIRPGARLRIVATQERVDGAFVRWASLDAVEYFPASAGAPPVRVYWFGDDEGHHGWYDARGRQPYHGGWRMPLPLAHVVSRFNPHRMHPILHVVMPHNGVDLAASIGSPVYATAAGNVISAGNGGACGNMVEIEHPGGYTSVYCHLSRFAAGLHPGQHVESRQLVAYSGQSGRATGPHLHFGMKHNGLFIDPMSLRLDGVRVVPRGRRDEFDRVRAQLDGELDAIPVPEAKDVDATRPSGDQETFYEEP